MKSAQDQKTLPLSSPPVAGLNLQLRDFDNNQTESDLDSQEYQSQSYSQGNSGNILQRLLSSPPPTGKAQDKVQNNVQSRVQRQPNLALKSGASQLPIQTKLNIGEPDDKYEQEADQTAAKVVQQINSPSDPPIQREEMMEEEDEELQMKPISSIQRAEMMEEEDEELQMKPSLQTKENVDGGAASAELESSIQSARGSGQSLDAGLQTKMGQAMGADFSHVRVHTDSRSDQLNQSIQARAFTTGQDLFFRQGEYNPSSTSGQELIAHELTHVMQQNPVAVNRQISRKMIRRKAANAVHIQPKLLVTSAKFKSATPSTGFRKKRSKELKAIDVCIKKIEQTGEDLILMSELLEAIRKWQEKAKDDDPRRNTINALRMHVADEVAKLSRDPANDRSNLVGGAVPKPSGNFSDFDSKQFRVSGRAPSRKIEEVKRNVEVNGDIVYYATGLVTGFDGKVPIIEPYKAPISLGAWYPTVTHINGMAVAPKGGILSAAALQESVNDALEAAGTDMSVAQNVVDLLYTYSALRGGTAGDLWDCIKGKVQVEDEATVKQEEIMLDAVRRQERVTVSAHSRGTIKTDNAVRQVHKVLAEEFIPVVKQSADNVRRVKAYCKYAYEEAGILPEAMAAQCYKVLAAEKAKEDMNKFVQLIYAGNAVQHPSRFIDINMYVGGMDFVSMFVGTYSETGRRIDAAMTTGGSKKSKLHSVGGGKGHGFVGNYVPGVSQAIAQDIMNR